MKPIGMTLKSPKTLMKAYKSFLNKFSDLYNTYFPKKQIKLKSKDFQSPWTTNGIRKSFKGKQCLYEMFLKIGMKKMSLNTKLTRNFLNQLKNVPRNYTFQILFLNTNIT